jgi:ABC-2 type transport system ATP-binding protein
VTNVIRTRDRAHYPPATPEAIVEGMNDTVIETRNLQYSYGQFEAVRGVDLTVQRGEVYALLGTNGAGKTTTLETLEGHRRPTKGAVSVFGGAPDDRARVRPRMGIMLQESGLAPDLSVLETVRLTGAISGRTDDAAHVIDLAQLGGKASTRVTQLSGGEKRRLDFAIAIYGSPDLLFLDEPTTGLDPTARDGLWDVVRDLRQRGTTVLLTTHYLEEAERHADRIGIMHAGRIEREGSLAELVAGEAASISFTAPPGVALPLAVASTENGLVTIESQDVQRDLWQLLSWAETHGHTLERLQVSQSSLDDLFRSISAR